ncbi:hypothetical protein LCGC14_2381470 [marine sediment metagenome]|uniref:Uncharacterized protein n=1 Tax=marine sediment metagenome TaxID=412755 RepID=A0A0F9EVK2_9ZZZZ
MSNDEKMDLILRANQIIIRDRRYNTLESQEKSRVIDEAITDILNPKINPGLAERTHDALKGVNE